MNVSSELSCLDVISEQFMNARIKIGIQKDGRLSAISRRILEARIEKKIPSKSAYDITTFANGRIGVVYTSHSNLPLFVACGAIDMAVVGNHVLLENTTYADDLDVRGSYPAEYLSRFVIATPIDSRICRIGDLRRIATSYPIIARQAFEDRGQRNIQIHETHGSTEIYPYLGTEDYPIDGIVEMVATGSSLRAHNLQRWSPAIAFDFPVLITRSRRYKV